MKIKTFPVLLAFLVMGIADAIGPMASAVEKNYELSAVVQHCLHFLYLLHLLFLVCRVEFLLHALVKRIFYYWVWG